MQLRTKPSGIYFIDYEDDAGQRQRLSCKTRDKEEAKRIAKQLVLGVHPSQNRPVRGPKDEPSADRRMTLAEGFDRTEREEWRFRKSQGTIRSNIKLLNARAGNVAIADLTKDRLQSLVNEMRDHGYAEASIKRKLDMVSKVLTLALDWEHEGKPVLTSRPKMPRLVVRNIKDRELQDDEEAAYFAAIEVRRQAEPSRQWWRYSRLARLLIDTGFRLSEALSVGPGSLQTSLVRTPDGSKHVHFLTLDRYGTKSDKPRRVPASAAILQEAEALSGQAVGGLWFPMKHTLAWYMHKQIREDLKKNGMEIGDITLHTFRHTCLSRLSRGGMDIVRLKEWAGHSDIKITAERYLHLIPADLVMGLDIINRVGSNGATGVNSFANPDSSVGGNVAYIKGNRA